ncbi:hypothetical protein SAMN05428982_2190 [Pseudoxanthomonas sp. CF385]|uniref:hypothetical protein n=1 Tax=Pseudoxanthomonas sp. CF385 TaxID=1881042 RepID=UPI000887173D|nr:hypothetical protein [Pseudoxanthomonas sp. CF385]SDQ84952.1 hypothetical protein SAMN05428982_2190 [Pseudoxanthomonas sp. CF385]
MASALRAISGEALTLPLWEVGLLRGLVRSDLRSQLGEPAYVETDTHRTYGGDEDWWFYATSTGASIAICLRVPYRDVAVYVSDPAPATIDEALAVLRPHEVERYEQPFLRR